MKANSTHLPRLIKAAIFGAFALSCGAISIAADNSDVSRIVVRFGDLNLSSPQGAARLYGRITAAANEVCKQFDIDSSNLESRVRLNACVQKAIADAVTKVGQPELLAIYSAKSHRPLPIIVAAARTR